MVNMFRKRLLILLFIVIIITLIISKCNEPKSEYRNLETDSANEVVPADWKIFKDKFGGYLLRYPKDWKLESKTAEKKMIRADIFAGDKAGLQIRMFNIAKQNPDVFLQNYLIQFINEMESHWSGSFTKLSEDKRDISDGHYFRVEYQFERGDGEKWFFIEYVWIKEDLAIAFQSGIDYDYMETYRLEFDLIADSFRFLD